MKIEVGDYIRLDGMITKVVKRDVDNHLIIENYYKGEKWLTGFEEANITKHSKNIIDLIEVGDFVNGYKIIMDVFVTAKGYTFAEDKIKTVLTHEQYEQNCFRMEEAE